MCNLSVTGGLKEILLGGKSFRPVLNNFVSDTVHMAVRHNRSQTKKSGGKTRAYRKSRKHNLGSEFSSPKVGEQKVVTKNARGNTEKNVAKKSDTVNLSINGEVKKADIESVEDNPANSNYVRRSLLTKGTIIQTSEGKARITSRPGQDGVVNAKLVEE